TLALWRETPRWDAWLESLEGRFPGLRSWLRNAIDLEQQAGASHTSADLAIAVRDETARRLADAPLGATVPKLAAPVPVVAIPTATRPLLAAAVGAPGVLAAAGLALRRPAAAAPPMTLVVAPGSITVVPGASVSVRARVEGSTQAPRLLGNGPTPPAVLESTS